MCTCQRGKYLMSIVNIMSTSCPARNKLILYKGFRNWNYFHTEIAIFLRSLRPVRFEHVRTHPTRMYPTFFPYARESVGSKFVPSTAVLAQNAISRERACLNKQRTVCLLVFSVLPVPDDSKQADLTNAYDPVVPNSMQTLYIL
jgi:hypothetical protein